MEPCRFNFDLFQLPCHLDSFKHWSVETTNHDLRFTGGYFGITFRKQLSLHVLPVKIFNKWTHKYNISICLRQEGRLRSSHVFDQQAYIAKWQGCDSFKRAELAAKSWRAGHPTRPWVQACGRGHVSSLSFLMNVEVQQKNWELCKWKISWGFHTILFKKTEAKWACHRWAKAWKEKSNIEDAF